MSASRDYTAAENGTTPELTFSSFAHPAACCGLAAPLPSLHPSLPAFDFAYTDAGRCQLLDAEAAPLETLGSVGAQRGEPRGALALPGGECRRSPHGASEHAKHGQALCS